MNNKHIKKQANKIPDTSDKIPLIFFPSLLSSRACHRVQEFKSPARVHNCTVPNIKCTPGRGGGGEESRDFYFQGHSGKILVKLAKNNSSGQANNCFLPKKQSVFFPPTQLLSSLQHEESEIVFIPKKYPRYNR